MGYLRFCFFHCGCAAVVAAECPEDGYAQRGDDYDDDYDR